MEQILRGDTVDELTSREVPLKVSFHKPYSDISKSIHPIMREKLLLSLLEEKNVFLLTDPCCSVTFCFLTRKKSLFSH